MEVVVLAFNRMQCPLTAMAARYTLDRRPNFDVYLLESFSQDADKEIFGPLFGLGLLYALAQWMAGSVVLNMPLGRNDMRNYNVFPTTTSP